MNRNTRRHYSGLETAAGGCAKITGQLLPRLLRMLRRSRRALLRSYRLFSQPLDSSKLRVLCVGFQKTGTSSFGVAMRHLGYRHYGYNRDLAWILQEGDVESCLEFASHFNSLDDLPWSTPEFVAAYRRRFPAARYVMLERDETTWLRSYFGYFGDRYTPEEALRRFRDHQSRILDLLVGVEHLLRMDICAGEGYEKLCPFLGIPVPDTPFPFENRGPQQSSQ
jgi:hypothetical protein